MEQIRATCEQLRHEARIQRKKVSEVSRDLIEYCETKKGNDCLLNGPANDHNPFQEKKSCQLL